MNGLGRAIAVGLTVVVLGGAVGCKRRLTPEKEMMNRLAGTWIYQQTKSGTPTTIELKLTAKGGYEQKTYNEVGGKRKLLYLRANPPDVAVEPDTKEGIAKLKQERYEPAVETGHYTLSLGERLSKIIFASDKVSAVDRTAGRLSREESFSFGAGDRLIIGGRIYQR